MAYSHCTGAELGQIQGPGLMSPNILHRNVHTGPRQEQEPGPLSPIVPVPFPVPLPCSVNKPLCKEKQSKILHGTKNEKYSVRKEYSP